MRLIAIIVLFTIFADIQQMWGSRQTNGELEWETWRQQCPTCWQFFQSSVGYNFLPGGGFCFYSMVVPDGSEEKCDRCTWGGGEGYSGGFPLNVETWDQ